MKKEFVQQLANYLAGNQALMSIKLQLRAEDALQWAALRATTPLRGWTTVEEAEIELTNWFGKWMDT